MEQLKRLRKKARMTQMELAIEAELSLTAVNYIESGKRRPKWTTAQRIAKALAKRLGRDWGEVLKELAEVAPHA